MKVCIVGAGAVGGLMAGWLGSRLGPDDLALSVLDLLLRADLRLWTHLPL